MKMIYKFYSRPDEEIDSDERLSIDQRYRLYAVTISKSAARKFQKDRDMSKFVLIKTEADEHEYVDYMNKNANQVLNYYEYSYKPNKYASDENKNIEWGVAEILSTGFEKLTVNDLCEYGFSPQFADVDYSANPHIFKEKYFRALYKLQYPQLWNIYASSYNNAEHTEEALDLSGIPLYEGEEFDYSTPDVSADEFEIFLFLYSGLFK